ESDVSGYGFELTFRLARGSSEDSPPNWSLNFLHNLARYVFSTGNAFASGHHMNLNGPIALDEKTLITAIAFCGDSELTANETPNGGLEFLQVVGITDDEFQATQAWNTDGVLEVMRGENPLLITDLGRGSMLDTPSIQETVDERKKAEGSTTSVLYNDATRWAVRKRLFGRDHVVVTLGANPALNVSMVLPGRIAFGRSLVLWSEKQSIEILPGDPQGVECSGNDLKIAVDKSQAARIAEIASLGVGEYEIEGLPQLSITVVPSIIRDQSGEEVKRVE
ncbi:MAG: suppressor of fused domain protein, partial [bacterium]|nr:suppressor of fused domain protein [bacterium]